MYGNCLFNHLRTVRVCIQRLFFNEEKGSVNIAMLLRGSPFNIYVTLKMHKSAHEDLCSGLS